MTSVVGLVQLETPGKLPSLDMRYPCCHRSIKADLIAPKSEIIKVENNFHFRVSAGLVVLDHARQA